MRVMAWPRSLLDLSTCKSFSRRNNDRVIYSARIYMCHDLNASLLHVLSDKSLSDVSKNLGFSQSKPHQKGATASICLRPLNWVSEWKPASWTKRTLVRYTDMHIICHGGALKWHCVRLNRVFMKPIWSDEKNSTIADIVGERFNVLMSLWRHNHSLLRNELGKWKEHATTSTCVTQRIGGRYGSSFWGLAWN